MAYRLFKLRAIVAEDSNLDRILYDQNIAVEQTKDEEVFTARKKVAPSDADTQLVITPVTTGYGWVLSSDYPIRVRFNSPSGTQLTLTSNNVPATNAGAPLPDNCFIAGTSIVTAIYLQPIASAAQTANVKFTVIGNPINSYI